VKVRRNVGRDILVDGYNVIKRDAALRKLEAKSQAAARDALITQLAQRYRHTPHTVTVVFDGASSSEQATHERRVRIIYSRAGEKADQVIARLAALSKKEGREVEMYSDDLEVRAAVSKEGGHPLATRQLTGQFDAPPLHQQRLARHRQSVRAQYGLNPYEGKDEDEREPPRKSKKKR
jgi:predicted RNA-binding protein with PIN domain